MNNQDPYQLYGRQILITGASSGIGRACAVLFAGRGASLCLLGRDETRLHETLSLTDMPNKHCSVSVDLTDYKCVADTVRELVKERGPISGIVNCAGISTTVPLNATTEEKMDHFIRTNVIGPLSLTCLLYTSDAADDLLCVDPGCRRLIKKKKTIHHAH